MLNNHDSFVQKPSSSKMARFAAGAFIAINLLASNPTYTQNQTTPDDVKKKNITEWVKTNDSVKKNTVEIDSLEHQKIITMNIDSLLAKYGQEKGMDIVNKNLVIEINKLRDSSQLSSLESSLEVIISAQKHTEYLDKIGSNDHIMSGPLELPNRLDKENITWETCGENLAEGQITIQELVGDWLKSKTHTANLLNPKFKKIGVGYKKGKRVYIAIG
ncbi:MAG: CAP domain-containing protein [candidate division SR1 bacterium]|nr:CAP domain-containing protein [candidate division SR1 bacterium]